MSLVDTYLTGLRKALPAEKLDELKHAHGACAADVQRLTERYPLCPASLVELLVQIDGTHYRDYPDGKKSWCWYWVPMYSSTPTT